MLKSRQDCFLCVFGNPQLEIAGGIALLYMCTFASNISARDEQSRYQAITNTKMSTNQSHTSLRFAYKQQLGRTSLWTHNY
jgi:hypothetical protein